MPNLKSLASDTVLYGISHILPRILNFVVMTMYLTHRFNENTTDFGIYSDLYAYATIILSMMIFRMDTAYFRFASREPDKEKVFFNTMVPLMATTIGICGVMLVFAQPIAEAMHYADSAHYVRWFAWILALDAWTTIVYARFRLARRPLRFMAFRIANVVLTIVFVMFFLEVLPRISPESLTGLKQLLHIQKDLDFVFLSNLLASIGVTVAMIPELLKMKWVWDRGLLTQILTYSWPLVVVAVAGNINQTVSVIVQKYWLPNTFEANIAEMGIFSAGAKLAILLNLFTTAFNYASEPFFFNQAAAGEKKKLYGQVARAYVTFACLVAVGTYLFIDVVMLMIGESYRSGVVVVPVLLMSYVLLGLYYMISVWYKLSDQTKIGAWVSVVGVVITLVTSYLLLPILGISGSAWASLACFGGMVGLCWWLGQRYYPIQYPWAVLLRHMAVTGFVLGLSAYLREVMGPGISLYLTNGIMFLVTVVYLWVSERDFLTSIVK